MSKIFVDKITGKTGTGTPPITLSGDTATLGSGVTFPAGHIIQVQNYFTNSQAITVTCAANAYTLVPTFQVSITPSSTSNKILIVLSLGGFNFSSTNYGIGGTGVFKRSIGGASFTEIGKGTGNTNFNESFHLPQASSTYYQGTVHKTFLDSPSTASACTYGIGVADHNNGTQTFYLNGRGAGSGDYPYLATPCSSIIVMEIRV